MTTDHAMTNAAAVSTATADANPATALLQQALDHHRAGRLREAERLYRAILAQQPQHPDANHNLGQLARQVGQPQAALPFLQRALQANPGVAQYWLSVIGALADCGHSDAARQMIEEAQRRGLPEEALAPLLDRLPQRASSQAAENDGVVTPAAASPHTHRLALAIAQREAGRYPEAIASLEQHLHSHPADAEAWALLAHVLLLSKQEARAAEALAHAQAIAPEHPVVRRNEARLLLKQNQAAAALEIATKAHREDPDNPESWLVLAAALAANQRDAEAWPLIERALAVRPDYAEAWTNRALLRLRAKDTAGALADIERALSLKPHLAQAWQLAASLRYETGDLPGAIEALRQALAHEPENIGFMTTLGEFLRRAERLDEALAVLEKAVSLAPEDYGAWVNYGTALQQAKRIEEAKAAYERALALKPDSAEIANNLGVMAKDREDWQEALRYFEQALAIQPEHADILSNKAVALLKLDRWEEALRYFEQALAIQPRHAGIMASKAELLILFGRLGEAQSVLDTALRLEPQNPEALCLLAKLQKTAPDSPAFAVLEDALSTATPSRQKVIHFALGKMYDETGRYALAFAHYQAGNALRRAKSGPYDAARDVAWLNIVQQMFPAEIFASLAEAGAPSRRPIFVFGMPRSGTTLVEQILASHAEVFGAGELEYFGKALGQLGEEKNGIRMVDARRPLQAEDIARVAQGYLDLLARLNATAKRVVDKMPHNFEFLGLMALCYPQATFLHIERDPLDTCLSCYFQDFSQKRHGYSDDLIDLGRHYLYYRAMMDYWHSVLPVPIHRVRYEALVSEPEQQIPQLLALCGLTMDENCLAPHRTERVVCTASRVQVREPIHRSSVQKWRRYEQELEPLVAVLRQGGVYV